MHQFMAEPRHSPQCPAEKDEPRVASSHAAIASSLWLGEGVWQNGGCPGQGRCEMPCRGNRQGSQGGGKAAGRLADAGFIFPTESLRNLFARKRNGMGKPADWERVEELAKSFTHCIEMHMHRLDRTGGTVHWHSLVFLFIFHFNITFFPSVHSVFFFYSVEAKRKNYEKNSSKIKSIHFGTRVPSSNRPRS